MPTHTCCGCVDILTAIKLRWESGLLAFGGRLLRADEPAAEPPNKKAGLRDEWKRPHQKGLYPHCHLVGIRASL